MKIAYLILAHINPGQLKRMIQRLHTANTWVYIHLDSKTPYTADFSAMAQELPNAFFISRRVNISWGAYSIIKAVLYGLQEIINSGIRFDYIHLMSGFDYPIKDIDHIFKFFTSNAGREFIHYRQLPIGEFYEGRMDRVWYYYDYDNIHSAFGSPGSCAYEAEMRRRGIKRSFIRGMKPYHGSTWWCLTGNCVKYILDAVNRNCEIENFFRYTKFPDEQFFQTLVMNSPFAQNALSENLWYLDWSEVNASHPKTLDMGDFPALTHTPALYARKLDDRNGSQLFDRIDRLLLKS